MFRNLKLNGFRQNELMHNDLPVLGPQAVHIERRTVYRSEWRGKKYTVKIFLILRKAHIWLFPLVLPHLNLHKRQIEKCRKVLPIQN